MENQITHKIKPEVNTNADIKKAYDELVELHQNYTNQLSYIGSLECDNDDELTERNEMIVKIVKLRYDVALYIIQTFYDELVYEDTV
jgi:glutathione peroxidase-family protein